MSRTISITTVVAVVALSFSVATAFGKGQPVDSQEPYAVGFDTDQYKRTVDQSQIVAPRGPHGLGNASSDFWNYDARTGQRTANTSPGLAPQDLAALYAGSTLNAYPASTVLINKALENPVSVAGGDKPAPVSVTDSREIEWPQIGIGLGIGALLMIGLYMALKATRHRPLAH